MERHLKKVFDCLNMGCNKKAVQEVDRLPKNIRDLPVFKSLKSLALIRMCKKRQAFELLNGISYGENLDEVTLQTMTSCYKESLEVARIVDLCEAATKNKPLDQEVLCHLFMAYVRVFNFKRQREIALVLYKNFQSKNRVYTFWAIMSLVMQAEQAKSKDATDRMVCLKLAEKMSEKVMDDKVTSEEIELYLTILRNQNKFEDEYRFLTGPILPRINDHLSWFNRRRGFLCLELKMYSRAFKHYFPTLIQEYPDQIEYYQGLFKSAFLLDTEAPSQQQPVAAAAPSAATDQATPQTVSNQSSGTPVKATSALAECLDIVERQMFQLNDTSDNTKESQHKSKTSVKTLSKTPSQNPCKGRRLLRGPSIARVELYQLILSSESTLPKNTFTLCKNQFVNRYPTLNAMLLEHFQNFSKKIICFYDMDHMVNEFKLTYDEKNSLVQSICQWVDDMSKQSSQGVSPIDKFFITLNHHLLEHSIRPYDLNDSRDQRIKLVKEYIDLYDKNRHLAKKKNESEFQPVDAYCLLAINAMMTNSINLKDLSKEQSILSDTLIFSLIVMAHNAVDNSPANHQLKLLLLKLYSLVGAAEQCSKLIFKLDIKHFQIDTLGHLLNPVLYNTGNYNQARQSLETCSDFYGHGIRECYEGLTQSYRDGRFGKVGEITSILKRLNNSLNLTQCILLKGIVAIVNAANNEDLLSAMDSFDPYRGLQRIFLPENDEEKIVIRDNRDFKVLRSLHSETTKLVKERQKQTLEDDNIWLAIRYYIIRNIQIQQEYISSINSDNGATNKCMQKTGKQSNNSAHDLLNETSEQLSRTNKKIESLKEEIYEAIDKNENGTSYSFLEPESSPIRWLNMVDIKLLLDLVTPLTSIIDPSRFTTQLLGDYSSNLEAIIDSVERQLTCISSLLEMKRALLTMTLSMEFISFAVASLYYITQIAKIANPSTAGSTTMNANQHQPQQSQTTATLQQPVPVKTKTIPNQMINKTETQLTRLANIIKSLDPKSQLIDKIDGLESAFLEMTTLKEKAPSSSNESNEPEAPIRPILDNKTTIKTVKSNLIDSYTDSIKEIENACRRKIKLLRS